MIDLWTNWQLQGTRQKRSELRLMLRETSKLQKLSSKRRVFEELATSLPRLTVGGGAFEILIAWLPISSFCQIALLRILYLFLCIICFISVPALWMHVLYVKPKMFNLHVRIFHVKYSQFPVLDISVCMRVCVWWEYSVFLLSKIKMFLLEKNYIYIYIICWF